MRKSRKVYFTATSLVALALIVILATFGKSSPAAADVDPVKPVTTITTKKENYDQQLSYKGIVAAADLTKLSFEQAGRVKSIYVEKGQAIRKGAKIAALDEEYIAMALESDAQNTLLASAGYEQASAGYNTALIARQNAQEHYERTQALYQEGGAPQQAYDQAKHQLNTAIEAVSQASARMEEAKAKDTQASIGVRQREKQLHESIILSPADGYIMDVLAESGEETAPGSPVAVVASDSWIVRVGVSVEDQKIVTAGMKTEMESAGIRFAGCITSVSQYPDESSRTYEVEITPDTPGLAAGSIVDVKIPVRKNQGVFIPVRSVFCIDAVDYVYVAKPSSDQVFIVEKKEVVLGCASGNSVEASNLEEGVIIITDGVKYIKEGDFVTPTEAGTAKTGTAKTETEAAKIE